MATEPGRLRGLSTDPCLNQGGGGIPLHSKFNRRWLSGFCVPRAGSADRLLSGSLPFGGMPLFVLVCTSLDLVYQIREEAADRKRWSPRRLTDGRAYAELMFGCVARWGRRGDPINSVLLEARDKSNRGRVDPYREHNRDCRGRCFRLNCGGFSGGGDHSHTTADQVSHQRRQAIKFSPSPLRNAATTSAETSADLALTNPITGNAACCARPTTGHVTALPTPAMNSLRFIGSPRRRSAAT
jgi:hypothetical protein